MSGPEFERPTGDTIWFGGDDGTGLPFRDGVWDWDNTATDPLQGWISVDVTENPKTYVYRVTPDSFLAHQDPCLPMFPGSSGQIWFGVHEDDAAARDFVGGMGYSNYFSQRALSPMLPIGAGDLIDITFAYFNHTEPDFDYTYLYILSYDSGGQFLGEWEAARFDNVHGSWDAPAAFAGTVPPGTLPPEVAEIQFEFRLTSDFGYSDEDGYWDSPCGPFAVDDIEIRVGGSPVAAYDFEEGDDGWTFEKRPGIGRFMAVCTEEEWRDWMDQWMIPPAFCLSGNALGLVDRMGPFEVPGHPPGHWECSLSGILDRGELTAPVWNATLVRYDAYYYSPTGTGTAIRPGYIYYPFTSPVNPTPHWSPRLGRLTFFSHSVPQCHTGILTSLSDFTGTGQHIPDDWEQMRFTFEVYCSCDGLGIPPSVCIEEGNTLGAPVLDNVQVGIAAEGTASLEQAGVQPRRFALHPSQPNPFNAATMICFDLPEAAHAMLRLRDVAGRTVQILVDGALGPGSYAVSWDGTDATGDKVLSGIYFCTLEAGSATQTRRLLLAR